MSRFVIGECRGNAVSRTSNGPKKPKNNWPLAFQIAPQLPDNAEEAWEILGLVACLISIAYGPQPSAPAPVIAGGGATVTRFPGRDPGRPGGAPGR